MGLWLATFPVGAVLALIAWRAELSGYHGCCGWATDHHPTVAVGVLLFLVCVAVNTRRWKLVASLLAFAPVAYFAFRLLTFIAIGQLYGWAGELRVVAACGFGMLLLPAAIAAIAWLWRVPLHGWALPASLVGFSLFIPLCHANTADVFRQGWPVPLWFLSLGLVFWPRAPELHAR